MGADSSRIIRAQMAIVKVAFLALAITAFAGAVKIDTAELKEAMDEAEDVDDALDWTESRMKEWGGSNYKETLKGMPPLQLKDNGITLAGSRDIMGKTISMEAVAASAELQSLAKAENRLAAAKQDVHEAAAASNPVKRAQLEDLAQELTEESPSCWTPPRRTEIP